MASVITELELKEELARLEREFAGSDLSRLQRVDPPDDDGCNWDVRARHASDDLAAEIAMLKRRRPIVDWTNGATFQ
jgi:hypothetical protein